MTPLKLSFVSLLTGICTTELLAYAIIVQRSGCDSTHESEAMDDAANFQAWHAIALILFLARDFKHAQLAIHTSGYLIDISFNPTMVSNPAPCLHESRYFIQAKSDAITFGSFVAFLEHVGRRVTWPHSNAAFPHSQH